MSGTYDDRDRRAIDRLEDLLDAYADARLTPTGPVLRRLRADVLANASGATAGQWSTASAPARGPRFAMPQLQLPRRAFALGMAATLTLGTGAAVLAAPPGSPFYNARLAINTVMLPTEADDRLAALEAHLRDRLHEAEAAAAAGDFGALDAALTAYRAEMDASLGVAGDDDARLARLESALAKHTDALANLATRVPERASIGHAIEASEKARVKANQKQTRPNGPPSDPGQGNRP